ncbi:Ger(x)C family spore germination protein [Halalkalibacter krulwichiae]|uniref:Spore germination protein B3 n=1 Tax=Halalkalibacter krulwichiae TaxID=199441 RepID=A0A1X9MF06_9BACI|nr:Ger(x)C family spore germination protein [Halalkalibacter krulwichiae]ARK30703.1 hypothetical protein BkAM31D_13155 [Halalkalibacter krulwichiae]
MKQMFFILTLLVCMSGCNNPHIDRPVIEDLGMIGVMGFDYIDEENTRVSVTIPQPNKSAQEAIQHFQTDVRLPHQSLMDISTLTDKTLSPAQLRVILFSEEYARNIGIWKIVENLYRDPHIGANIFIAVVKGSVEELLNAEYKDKPELNIYLTELLTPRTLTAFSPFTTIRDFVFRNTDEVSDPSVPYLERIDEQSIKITKVALFKNDKMVALLDPEQAKLVEAMKKRKKLPDIAVMIPPPVRSNRQEDEMVILKFVDTKYHTKVNGNLKKPTIYIYLYIRGSVVDYDGVRNLEENEQRKEIELAIESQLEEKVLSTVNHFQELSIDPVGFGDPFRIRNAKGWTKEMWNQAFKQAEISTHVETRIISTGAIK